MDRAPSIMTAAVMLAVFLCFQAPAFGTVLRVPEQYATIQSALDATLSHDTVLVAPGRYHEYLCGPRHSYSVIGHFPPDSVAADLWTLMDPLPPQHPDMPSTFHIRSDTVLVKNLAFFNMPEIRHGGFSWWTGGIDNASWLLRVENCRFDSVSRAIRGGSRVELESCSFTGCLGVGVQVPVGSPVIARHCRFIGEGYSLASSSSGSRYEDCEFICNTGGAEFLHVGGHDVTVARCRFGPCVGNFPVLLLWADGNCVIEDCIFEGIDRVTQVINVGIRSSESPDPLVIIRRNLFQDNHGMSPPTGTTSIYLECSDYGACNYGIIEDNVFVNCTGSSAPGIVIRGTCELNRNRFEGLYSVQQANISAIALGNGGPITARNNTFVTETVALETAGAVFDARWNWWGDSTGPYHPDLNPQGLGSEVGDYIDFSPWLLSPPDSSDTSGVSVDVRESLLPETFQINTYPNPFNASVTLTLEVTTPGLYALQLYDVTGREVALVYRGLIRDRKELRYANPELASGVYFARLSNEGSALAVTKLLLLK